MCIQGVRVFVNDNKYIGSFFNGVMEGGGIMSFANGNQYAGDWKQGHMDGNVSVFIVQFTAILM